MNNLSNGVDPTFIKALVLRDGMIPQKAEPNARGHDVFVSGIVTSQWDSYVTHRRKRLWDFKSIPHSVILPNVSYHHRNPEKNYFILRPNQAAMIGIGVVFGMTPGWCAWIAARSSTAIKRMEVSMQPALLGSPIPEMKHIVDHMSLVPIDCMFRAEPICYLANHGSEDFHIAHGQRIGQLVFTGPGNNFDPIFEEVDTIDELGTTLRANGNNGSTGNFEIKPRSEQMHFPGLNGN